jgi:hypothetical protein
MPFWIVTSVLFSPRDETTDCVAPVIGLYTSKQSALAAAKKAFESECNLDSGDSDDEDTFESYLQPSSTEKVTCYVMDNDANFYYACTITEVVPKN